MFRNAEIIPIDWTDGTEKWIFDPSLRSKRTRFRSKKLSFFRKNCYYAKGIPKGIFNFIYRATRRLGLTERPLFFARGTVKKNGTPVKYALSIRELDWDVGILIIIPRSLKYNETIRHRKGAKEHIIRTMEMLLLGGLLKIAYPGKKENIYSETAVLILANGWEDLNLIAQKP